MDEFYRVPFSSAEAQATLAALRALHGIVSGGAVPPGDVEPDVLQSAAERIAAELPEFMVDHAERLAGSLVHALVEAGFGEEMGDADGRTEPPFPIGRTRRLLEDAFDRKAPVEIEYYVQSRKEWTTRRVDISDVYERDGNWYLAGHCGMRGDYRMFHLTHIRAIRTLDSDDEAEGGRSSPFLEE